MHVNARRNNIPDMLPVFEGMKIRINNGSGSHYEEYGLHTSSLGTVIGMQFTENDTEKLENTYKSKNFLRLGKFEKMKDVKRGDSENI